MKTVASESPRATRAPGTRLVWAGVFALAAAVVSWLVFNAVNGGLNEVDLTVYRDGGLIVRHVQPYYDPRAYAPLYDWGGYSSLALKFTYTPFAAVAFAAVSLLPWAVTSALSVVVNDTVCAPSATLLGSVQVHELEHPTVVAGPVSSCTATL